MNYNFLSQLVDNGISEEELIASLSKSVPRLANQARKMFFGGWSPKEVLGMFSKDKEVQKVARKGLKPVTPSEMASYNLRNSYNNIPQSSGQESKQKLSEFTKKAAPLALGAIASPMAGSVIQSALQRALPQTDMLPDNVSNPTRGQPQMPNSPTGLIQPNNSNQYDTPQQPPLSNANAASIPQPPNIEQPKQNSNIVDKLYSGFEKGRDKGFDFESDAFLKVAKRMKSTGEIRSKEDFERFFNLFDAKKNEGKDLPTALKESSIEYDNQKVSPSTTNEKPESNELVEKEIDFTGMGKGMADNLYKGLFESLQKGSTKFAGIEDPFLKKAKEPFEKGLIKSPEDLKKFANGQLEQTKIEKNSVVSSPNGVGEVKEIRNGQALVEVDGRLHKVKEEDLEASPMPEKDLADLYDDLISGIEKDTGEDVSRMVQWAGYNPETNTLQFLPHSGKLYKYGDISPEDAALLTDILSTRKTTGSNFIGAWKAGSKSPIGAALSKLIRKLQSERGGKGQEYEETHEPIYSAYEPAVEAKKKKKKK